VLTTIRRVMSSFAWIAVLLFCSQGCAVLGALLGGLANNNPPNQPTGEIASGAPQQMTRTCQFTQGPMAGRTIFFGQPGVAPVPVGAYCTDGVRSSGFAVPDYSGGGSPNQPPMSTLCHFFQGPRFGQTMGIAPTPVGSSCTDGMNSFGTAIL
jgi:hypothetical protein